ncbi:MAG: IBR domain-containing protein [Candidatus Pacebacteria bacterium]|nr:IBR domain-containing protein [Candidatus Paceibacterota bacterium]
MEAAAQPQLPQALHAIAKCVAAISKDDKDSCVEDIENECTSLLSIYSEEAREVSMEEYKSAVVGSVPLLALVHKVVEINLFTHESEPYTLVIQEDEEKQSEHPLRFIPLLRLKIFFANSYPKLTAPAYLLTSNWLLPKYLAPLQKKMEAMWSPGTLVAFEWADYIQHEFLGTLEFAKGRKIAFPKNRDYHNLIDYLVIFDADRERQEFNNSEKQCGVCMRALPGSSFVRVPSCKHYSCRECFKIYVENKIMEGKVAQLCCFEGDCKSVLPDTVLKEVLSPDMFEKYEKFSVNKALESMTDIAWCPQCESPAFKDSAKSTVAQCAACDFRFCTKCNERFHPFERCKSLHIPAEMVGCELKESIEKQIDSGRVSTAANATLTNIYIKKYTKACPNCKAPIYKCGGCNKVGCTKCNKYFCWLCLKCVSSYDHFGEKCVLFTTESLRPTEDIDILSTLGKNDETFKALMEETKFEPTACPKCSAINLKTERKNLISCSACKSTYCFFCGCEANESHFLESACLKYS